MATRFMPVRVLYTIDSSPQYMLARSVNSTQVSLVHSATPLNLYGKTRLETCIQAINRSSPELFDSEEDDYSIYLLDPLESQQRNCLYAASTGAVRQPQSLGVAVGLGLLSSLNTNSSSDEVLVTGTVSTGQDGTESLEVVFNLREVRRKSKSVPKQTRKRSTSTKDTKSSKSRPYPPLANQGLQPSTVLNVQEHHRHYPNKAELYSNWQPSHGNYYDRGQHSRLGSRHSMQEPSSSQESSVSITSATSSQTIQDSSSTSSLQHLLNVLSSAKNTDAVLSMLSLIHKDSSSNQPAHSAEGHSSAPSEPILSEALRKLLTAAISMPVSQSSDASNSISSNELPTPSSAEQTPSPTPADNSFFTSPEPNEAVGVSNKENADPSAGPNAEDNQKQNKEFKVPSSHPLSWKSSISINNTAPTTRKRPLSEISDDKDHQREHPPSQFDYLSHARSMDLDQVRQRLTYLSSQPQSDPSYGWNYNSYRSAGWATAKVKDARLVAAEGGSTVATNSSGSKRRFVVPDWAKTETATVPRLSEEAAEKLRPNAKEDDKSGSVKAKPVLKKAKAGSGEKKRKAVLNEPSDESQGHAQSEPAMSTRQPLTPKKKVKVVAAEMADLPIVATSSPAIFNSSPLASHSSIHLRTPKTPTAWKRNSSPSRTPKRSVTRSTSLSPLFTPGSGNSTTPKLPSLFSQCSPLFSRSRRRSSPPEITRQSNSMDLEEEDHFMNSLPGASSDVEEETPMKILSSSPPPSSPILTSSDDEGLQVVATHPPDTQDKEGIAPNFMQDFEWLKEVNPCVPEDSLSGFDSEEFMELMKGTVKDTASSSAESAGGSGDLDAKLAAEIFSWTSADGTGEGDGFQLGEFWNSVKPLMEASGDGGLKLANEMRDLFGGCVI